MARRVFYSFHYKPDCHRAAQIRNMGVVDGNKPVTDNDWEAVTRAGSGAIERWIEDQLAGKSCVVVLIGANTAGRKWINYEIKRAWDAKKGLVGVYIHRLKNLQRFQVQKGANPFDPFTMTSDRTTRLSSIIKAYNPPYDNSKDVYAYIEDNLPDWIEEAVEIRDDYGSG